MNLMRMPIFVWMALVSQFLLLFAIPVITVALFLLSFDRLYHANFFVVQGRRRFLALATPVLDLRSSGGVHPRPPGHGDRVRGHAGVRPQAVVRVLLRWFFSGIAIGFMGWGVA